MPVDNWKKKMPQIIKKNAPCLSILEIILRNASHVENHDATTLQFAEAPHIYTASGSDNNNSQRNLYEHDATYFNPSR